MAPHSPTTSFSRGQQWRIGTEVFLVTLIVVVIVAMLNYLSSEWNTRLHLSTHTRAELAPRTLNLLKTLTNKVKVTIYFDKTEPFYSTIADLLQAYSAENPNISVQTVDYLRDAATAQRVKNTYQLTSGADKNLVIFDSQGRSKLVDGTALSQYTLEQVPSDNERKFRRKPVAFLGELAFTAAILEVTSPRQFTALFLQDHREHDIESGDEVNGYLKLASYLKQNSIKVGTLSLVGTNTVPLDCNLLVIAGPKDALLPAETEKISQYLSQGGRMLALFNSATARRELGLEKLLGQWGVGVGHDVVVDREHSQFGSDVVISAFSKHPMVNPLLGTGLYMIQPRTISRIQLDNQPADAPKVEEVAFSGKNSFRLGDDPSHRSLYPVIATAEKGAPRGVITERGSTRIVVVGDSTLFTNQEIDLLGNRDFAGYAVNWLLDRPELLQGIGPRPVKEFRLIMTRAQAQSARWLLLGGMPGTVLLLGGLVWLRRRR